MKNGSVLAIGGVIAIGAACSLKKGSQANKNWEMCTENGRIRRETEKSYYFVLDSGPEGWLAKSLIRRTSWVPGYEPNQGHSRLWNYKRLTFPCWVIEEWKKGSRSTLR